MAQSPRATRPLSPVAATTSATKRAQSRAEASIWLDPSGVSVALNSSVTRHGAAGRRLI
jgi:hypothetical protein